MPAEQSGYADDWPVWSRIRLENTRSAGNEDGIFSG